MYPVLRKKYNQRSPTRVPAPCTDSMPGPSVHPPGRRATVACVLLPDVRSSARPVAQPVKAKHGGMGAGGGAAAPVHVRAVQARRGGGSPAVCAEVVHAAGDARWARRPPQATAFRGEGDGEGGVEGGWRGRRRRRCRSSRWHQDCRRHSGGDDRHWDAAKRESARRTRADCTVSQAMVGQRIGSLRGLPLGGGGERCGQGRAAAQQTVFA